MTTWEMTMGEHVETARRFLEQSEGEFATGDILQGSEKIWGAVSHATTAAAMQRGWATESHLNGDREIVTEYVNRVLAIVGEGAAE